MGCLRKFGLAALCITALHAPALQAQNASGDRTSRPVGLEAATNAHFTTLKRLSSQGEALAASRRALQVKYEGSLQRIDQGKKGRATWRRDRELRKLKADSKTLSQQLSGMDARLARQKSQAAAVQKKLLLAIQAELSAGGASVSRSQTLERVRAKYARKRAAPPRKIVLPDSRLDPLAGPDELREQLAFIKQSESKLESQERGLLAQADRLNRSATLRRKSARARQFEDLDDDRVSRSTLSARAESGGVQGSATAEPAADSSAEGAPPANSDNLDSGDGGRGSEAPQDADMSSSLDSLDDASIILSEVVDGETRDALRAAALSKNPGTRAKVARAASESVHKKRKELERLRLRIEKRLRTMTR